MCLSSVNISVLTSPISSFCGLLVSRVLVARFFANLCNNPYEFLLNKMLSELKGMNYMISYESDIPEVKKIVFLPEATLLSLEFVIIINHPFY